MINLVSFLSHIKKVWVSNTENFHLISWCRSFAEVHSFRRFWQKLWKLCLSVKFPFQIIRWHYGFLRNVYCNIQCFLLCEITWKRLLLQRHEPTLFLSGVYLYIVIHMHQIQFTYNNLTSSRDRWLLKERILAVRS